MAVSRSVERPLSSDGNSFIYGYHIRPTIPQSNDSYFAQLICNFVWPLIFFNMGAYLLAFIWLIALIILVTATIILFYKISKTSALLFAPYMVWLLFAGYLNWGIYMLN